MTDENWRPVVGFEDQYEVSDQGRVRSLDRAIPRISKLGRPYRHTLKGRVLAAGASNYGHLSVVLGRGNTRQVHALVLDAFIGPCPPGLERRHINGDPKDNALSNLAYGTRSENMKDRARHGRYKLSPEDVAAIRARKDTGVWLSRLFNCSPSQISNIKRGLQRVGT